MKYDRVTYENKTANMRHREKLYLRFAKKLSEDADKKLRIAKGLCKFCYYDSSRIGGARMTHAVCALCENEITFGNTAIDVICPDCAQREGICKHCGADVNYVIRRKPFTRKDVQDEA